MANAGIIQAELSMNVGPMLADARRASEALERIGKSGALLKPVDRAFTDVAKSMKEFKGEQIAQARTARFFAGELAAIIPAADGVKSALQSVLALSFEGLAGGMGAMFVIELAKTSAELWNHFAHQAEEAANKSVEALGKVADKMTELRQRRTNVTEGDIEASRLETAKKLAAELAAAKKEYYEGYTILGGDSGRLEAAQAAVDAFEKAHGKLSSYISLQKELTTELRAQEAARSSATSVDLASEARLLEAKTDRQKAEAQYTNDVLTIQRKWLDGSYDTLQMEEAITNAYTKRGLALEHIRDLTLDLREAQIGATLGGFEDSRLTLSSEERARLDEEERRRRERELDRRDALQKSRSGQDAYEFPDLGGDANLRASILAKGEAAELKLQAGLWNDIADAIGNAANSFAGLGAAIGGVAGEMVNKMIEVMVAAVKMAIALAAAANAPLGPPGWINAIGAAVTLAATMASVLAGVQPRAAGGPVRSGQPYLVGERGPEIVVPGQSGYVIPNHQVKQGAATGPSITFHISTMDGPSVYRTLTNARGDVARFLREFSRDGRG